MTRSLTYNRFPLEFTYNRHWTQGKKGHELTIGRVPICPMSQHSIERYCLRLQLHHVLGATGYEVNSQLLMRKFTPPSWQLQCPRDSWKSTQN